MSAHAAPDVAPAEPDELDIPAASGDLVHAHTLDELVTEYAASPDAARRVVALDLTRTLTLAELADILTDDAP